MRCDYVVDVFFTQLFKVEVELENCVCKIRIMPRAAPVPVQCTTLMHLLSTSFHKTIDAVNYTNPISYDVENYTKD